MPDELDPKIADRLASSTMVHVEFALGGKVASAREVKQAILHAVQEAYEIGFMAGEKRQLGDLTRPGSTNRPVWMDVRLDDPESLAARSD